MSDFEVMAQNTTINETDESIIDLSARIYYFHLSNMMMSFYVELNICTRS